MSNASTFDLRTAVDPDAWAWWEARRFRYNLALAASGWAAYALTVGLHYAFGHWIWTSWREAAGLTLLLGTGFLVLMFAANVLYLVGAWTESFLAPADVSRFRQSAYALGFWGSVALPFVFPLLNLAFLIAANP